MLNTNKCPVKLPGVARLFVVSLGLLILNSCSQTVLVTSSTHNPPGNDAPLDKKAGTAAPVLSVSNDYRGVLINIRIPGQYDQYKILKYGALLSVTTDRTNKIYGVAYPLENTDKKLRLPISKKGDSSFHINELLEGLATEANQLAAFQFYGRQNYTSASNHPDSLAVQVVKEPGQDDLIYTAFIPYSSIPDFARPGGVNQIKIRFQSAFLNLTGGKGLSSDKGPYYMGYAGYFGPYYSIWGGPFGPGLYDPHLGYGYGVGYGYGYGGYWGGLICRPWLGYVSTMYSPPSKRYIRKHPNLPIPNTQVLKHLTAPIDVQAKISLAR